MGLVLSGLSERDALHSEIMVVETLRKGHLSEDVLHGVAVLCIERLNHHDVKGAAVIVSFLLRQQNAGQEEGREE